ncbi:hypothetical protein ACKWTF_004345 [Chironomus riparius]
MDEMKQKNTVNGFCFTPPNRTTGISWPNSAFRKEDILEEKNQKLKIRNNELESELNQEKLKCSKLTKELQTGLLGDIKACIQEESTKDFKVLIENREFDVHKFLLIARSPTIADILRNNPEIESLSLLDIPVDIFENILKFLFTDVVPDDNETNFLYLFAAAGKLKIKELKQFAADQLLKAINQENVMEVFMLSSKYGDDKLKRKAFDEIKKMFPKYVFKDVWISSYELVMKVIEQFKKYEEAIRKIEEEFNMSNI